jgi:hypothetical protein
MSIIHVPSFSSAYASASYNPQSIAMIKSEEYIVTNNDIRITSDLPLPISVSITGNISSRIFNIKIGTNYSYMYSITQLGQGSDPLSPIANISVLNGPRLSGMRVNFPGSNVSYTSSTLQNNISDTYIISVGYPLYNEIKVYFYRKQIVSLSYTNTLDNVLTNENIETPILNNVSNNGDMEIPILNIVGQTTVNQSDVSDILITIYDKYKYYEEKSLSLDCNHKCKTCYINSLYLKETQLVPCNPELVSVVRGKGVTLNVKLEYLYKKYNLLSKMTYNEFYGNIFFYGMVKFTLCRILYGNFNINYLSRNYNKKFIKDLKHSRFCGALPIFTSLNSSVYGYNKYFHRC